MCKVGIKILVRVGFCFHNNKVSIYILILKNNPNALMNMK